MYNEKGENLSSLVQILYGRSMAMINWPILELRFTLESMPMHVISPGFNAVLRTVHRSVFYEVILMLFSASDYNLASYDQTVG